MLDDRCKGFLLALVPCPAPVDELETVGRHPAGGAEAEAGARVQLVAKSGKAWTATVAETVQTRGDGHLVTLRGAEWSADPDAPIADPDWMHDDPPEPAK